MKKVLTLLICCFLLSGCNENENASVLIGEWTNKEKPSYYESGWGNIFSYEFKDDGTVTYYECLHLTLSDDGCAEGSSVWNGTYKLENNIIKFENFKIDKTDSYNPSSRLKGPYKEIIIDFDNMYFCDREKGLDCDKKYEKDTTE